MGSDSSQPDEGSTQPAETAPPQAQWTPPPPFTPVFQDQTGEALPPPRFISARRLAWISIACLAFAGVAALAQAVHFIVGLELLGKATSGQMTLEEAQSFDDQTVPIALMGTGLFIISGIAFLRWLWRSTGNAVQLDAGFGIVDPRGAVTAWLVPIRNLWKPYQVVLDLHDRLLAPLQSRVGRWLIRIWWVFWIIGTVAAWMIYLGTHPVSFADQCRLWAIIAIGSAVNVADAILAIAVVLQLQRLADAREAARNGDPNRAIALVMASQRPSVTRLPFALGLVALVCLAIPTAAMYASTSAYTTSGSSGSWLSYTAPDGSFTVSVPSTPLVTVVNSNPNSAVVTTGRSFAVRLDSETKLAITYADYPAGLLGRLSPDTVYDNITASLSAYTVQSKREITTSGRLGREVTMTSGSTWVKARLLVVGDRVYIWEADTIESQMGTPDIDRFLDSFAIN